MEDKRIRKECRNLSSSKISSIGDEFLIERHKNEMNTPVEETQLSRWGDGSADRRRGKEVSRGCKCQELDP